MGEDPDLSWMVQMCKEYEARITFVLAQLDYAPDAWRETMSKVTALSQDGLQLKPQVAGRPGLNQK